MKRPKHLTLLSQILIAIVLISNLIAAIPFILNPMVFVSGFELSGVPGMAAVVGTGILFLMWQVPYVFALSNPIKRFTSLIEATIMQIIGLLGESLLYTKIDPSFATLRSSIARFILFDGLGLVLLIVAWAIISRSFGKFSAGGNHV